MAIHLTLTRPTRWAAGLVLGAVLVGGVPASAQPGDTVGVARARLATATAARRAAEARVTRLTAARDRVATQFAAASAELGATAAQIAEAREELRERAVEAFIVHGSGGRLAAIFGSDRLEDISVRTSLIMNQASAAADAADLYQQLRDQNDPEVVRLGVLLDDTERRLASARDDLLQTAAIEADAERALTRAIRQAAAARAVAARAATARPAAAPRTVAAKAASKASSARATATRVDQPADQNAAGWAALVKCESGGNYAAVSSSGRYRGAYQFDQRTWESVGGVGDPAAAPPAEQDYRARRLYEQRGARAWPHCGIHLRR